MKIDANDPKWTAYALGEITDENERAEIEKALRDSPEMLQLVDEIRETAGLLKRELRDEPAIPLTEAQRKRIESKANTGSDWFGLRPAWVLAAAAAAVLMISVVTVRHMRQADTLTSGDQLALVVPMEPALSELRRQDNSRESRATPAFIQKDEAETKREAAAESIAVPEKKKSMAVSREATASANKSASMASPEVVQQTRSAVLTGTVKDTSGAAIPGAAIKVTDQATGITSQTVTNAAGQYSFPVLDQGPYTLTANVPGFQTSTYANIAVNAASSTKLDVDMKTGALQSAVEAGAVDAPQMTAGRIYGNGSAMGGGISGGVAGGVAGGMFPSSAPAVPPLNYAGAAPQEGDTVNDARYGRPWPVPPRPRRGIYPPWQKPGGNLNTEAYNNIVDNPFLDSAQNPLSTFSIDVDTASYSNVRRFLDGGKSPPKDAVRIEELVNYFSYDYKGPKNGKPFAASFEITEAPWKPEHRLLRIGLKAREVAPSKRPNSNLVFLLDVSGSMADRNKLPLVKESMMLLVNELTESDRVAIVVYASDTSVFLPSTSGDQKEKLRSAIERLHASGSTNGASGIQLAYQTARNNFIPGGVNRVILATDGDFNVGITNQGDLARLIEDKAKSGIFLSALGFGMGNYKDSTLEMLATKGRGNYAYIDNLNEARRVLVEQINATLVSVAKDVKIQVEFNPQRVSSYRLIGYEDRIMAKEDFNDDAKQAGVIGAGHAVTALYEIVPAGVGESKPGVDPLKYQKQAQPSTAAHRDELLTVKVRSKDPEKDTSVLTEFAVKDSREKFGEASRDFKFAAAVAAFGMTLRDSPYKGSATLESALDWAKAGKGEDRNGYRQEFIRLIHRAISISD
jgi:Ca-activated chloride channel family protein